jgi:hypothetical protein
MRIFYSFQFSVEVKNAWGYYLHRPATATYLHCGRLTKYRDKVSLPVTSPLLDCTRYVQPWVFRSTQKQWSNSIQPDCLAFLLTIPPLPVRVWALRARFSLSLGTMERDASSQLPAPCTGCWEVLSCIWLLLQTIGPWTMRSLRGRSSTTFQFLQKK